MMIAMIAMIAKELLTLKLKNVKNDFT